MKNTLIFAIAITLAGISGFGLQRYLAKDPHDGHNPAIIPTPKLVANTPRPDFAMPDLDGKLRDINEWDGKIIIINFWATWCAPCMEEIPDLIELQNRYGKQGLQVIGIAIDKEENVREFAKKMGINYPLMASETAGELSSLYGNHIGGLPFTAIINRDGKITEAIIGILDIPRAEKILSRLGIDT